MEPEASTLSTQETRTNSLFGALNRPEGTRSSLDEKLGLPFNVPSDDGSQVFVVDRMDMTIGRMSFLWAMAQKHNIILPDWMRKDVYAFQNFVLAESTIILSVNNFGIVYATDVVPGDSALLHYFFWDKSQRNRQKLLLTCMKWLCDNFHLHRMTCTIPRFATAALHRVYHMGFRLEGVMLQAMLHNQKRADCFVFGILSDELTEDALANGRLARTDIERQWYSVFRDDPRLLHKVLRRPA